jgi:hypothetical protein
MWCSCICLCLGELFINNVAQIVIRALIGSDSFSLFSLFFTLSSLGFYACLHFLLSSLLFSNLLFGLCFTIASLNSVQFFFFIYMTGYGVFGNTVQNMFLKLLKFFFILNKKNLCFHIVLMC